MRGVRAELDARAAREGWPALHAELARVDPATAARLAPTDAQRIQRALEVHRLTGQPLSTLQGRRDGRPAALGPTIPVALLSPDRAALHAAIAQRFARDARRRTRRRTARPARRFALDPAMPSMRCVGYRQAWQYLDGRNRRGAMREKGIAATRQLAKRQLTWLRRTPATAFDAAAPDVADLVAALVIRIGGRKSGALTAARALTAPCCYAIMTIRPMTFPRQYGRTDMTARTLYDKLWDSHVIREEADGTALLYIDRHLVHEVTSPQAFEGLQLHGRKPWRVQSVVATADHNTPTKDWNRGIQDPISRTQVETLDENIREHGAKAYFPFLDRRQGIVHVIGPEQGATLPGMTVVCGDSHTSTHGAFAALAFGIGTSEVEHVLATQCLLTQEVEVDAGAHRRPPARPA